MYTLLKIGSLGLLTASVLGCSKAHTLSSRTSAADSSARIEVSLTANRLNLTQDPIIPSSAKFTIIGGTFTQSHIAANFNANGRAVFTVSPGQSASTAFTMIVEEVTYSIGTLSKTIVADSLASADWAKDKRVKFQDSGHSVLFGLDVLTQLGTLSASSTSTATFIATEFASRSSVRAAGAAGQSDASRTANGDVSFDQALPINVLADAVNYDGANSVMTVDFQCTDATTDGDAANQPMNILCKNSYLFGNAQYVGEVFATVIPLNYDSYADSDSYAACAASQSQDINVANSITTKHGTACDQPGYSYSIHFVGLSNGNATFRMQIEGVSNALAGVTVLFSTGYSQIQLPILLPDSGNMPPTPP